MSFAADHDAWIPRAALLAHSRTRHTLLVQSLIGLLRGRDYGNSSMIACMHILLPPSEGKSAPAVGPHLDLSAMTWPDLTQARHQAIEELITVSPSREALSVLRVGKRIAGEVEAQRDLWNAPCAPAREVYTGVLFEAAKLHAGDDVVIFSGLFGATTAEDLIPSYRLSINVSLPITGALKSFWRHRLERADFLNDDVVVDMRSGAYQVWDPRGIWWDTKVTDSHGKVVTHMAKRYRGLLTRALLDAKTDEVADVARTLGEVRVTQKDNRRHLVLIPEGM